jgi:hypothetical protein
MLNPTRPPLGIPFRRQESICRAKLKLNDASH